MTLICGHVWKPCYKYYLQHERPCCIGYTSSSRRRELVYPIQHGREEVLDIEDVEVLNIGVCFKRVLNVLFNLLI